MPKRQARTVSLETGIQNTTVTITVITFNFPGNIDDPKVRFGVRVAW
jgi:predicted Na+-dependent transporter